MYRHIQKTLEWGVKLASLAVTGPATWIVSAELFADVTSPALLFVMQFSAVFLVEGVLLSNWLLLEFDTKANPEIKAGYGLTALAMYVGLLVIGWKHEGPAGLVFRGALLAALIRSGWDTYAETWRRATSRVDRNIAKAAKVRRHARRLSIGTELFRRQAQYETDTETIGLEKALVLQQINDAHAVHLEAQKQAKQRLMSQAKRGLAIAANVSGNDTGRLAMRTPKDFRQQTKRKAVRVEWLAKFRMDHPEIPSGIIRDDYWRPEFKKRGKFKASDSTFKLDWRAAGELINEQFGDMELVGETQMLSAGQPNAASGNGHRNE